jgi:hypothetical protein
MPSSREELIRLASYDAAIPRPQPALAASLPRRGWLRRGGRARRSLTRSAARRSPSEDRNQHRGTVRAEGENVPRQARKLLLAKAKGRAEPVGPRHSLAKALAIDDARHKGRPLPKQPQH